MKFTSTSAFITTTAKVGLLLGTLTLASCGGTKIADSKLAEAAPAPVSRTTTNAGNKFTNEFFKVSVEKPEGWYSADSKEADAQREKGGDLIAGKDKNMKALVEAAQQKTTPLFSFFEVPPGTPGKSNSNIIAIAEDIKAAPGVKTGCDYLTLAKNLSAKSQVKIDFADKCETKNINGTDFNFVDAQINMGGQTIKQRYFAVIRNEHAISMVQTFTDDGGQAKVDKVLETLTVKN
jgi:hypothetical protein